MNFPDDVQYTKEHEWIKVSGNTAVVGVTDFAQKELGDIVFVDLPETGRAVKEGEAFCVLESTKVASDVYAPIAGTVLEVNRSLSDSPDLVNSSPYGDGWLVKLGNINAGALSGLMTAAQYSEFVGSR